MSDGSEQAALEDREDETLVFRQVGHLQLQPEDENEPHGDHVVLAAASAYGLACITDAAGVQTTSQADCSVPTDVQASTLTNSPGSLQQNTTVDMRSIAINHASQANAHIAGFI